MMQFLECLGGWDVETSMMLLKAEVQDAVITLITDGPRLKLTFLDPAVFRVRVSWDEQFLPERSYTLVKTAWADELDEFMAGERVRIKPLLALQEETEKSVILKTDSLEVRITKDPFGISVYSREGIQLHSDILGKAYHKDHLGRLYHYSLQKPGDGFYGFGEKTGVLNKIKRRLRMSNKDTIGYDPIQTDPLYKHIPFYIVLNQETQMAHGIFYHNSHESFFDMGAERSGYWPAYTHFVADGGELDWFFCYGPTVKEVVNRYTDLTGKTVLPPRYTLGYMGSSMYYTELPEKSDDAIVDFINRAGEEGIPCEGFFLSSGYTSGIDGKRYVFEWNQKRFPNPAEFVSRLQKKGAELCPNIKPGMLLTHPRYQSFEDAGAYILDRKGERPHQDRFWGGAASFVDFTSPNGRTLWKEGIKEALLANGITTIWNDNCEYESQDLLAQCHGDGKAEPLAGLRPVLPNLMAKMAREAMAEFRPTVRPYVLNRAGFAGIQRYASTWCGDNMTSWESLKYNIPTMLGMGLSGVANQGSDIGGFAGSKPEPELLVRWIQQGIFQPRFCIHSCNDDNTVTEPWMYPSYTCHIRNALQFRYTLIPYLYSLLYEASVQGAPFMRPLFYEFQEDQNVYNESFDYLCGPSLLVANVLEKGARKRCVYLPEGTHWREWGTWTLHKGGQWIEVDAPLDKIPLFVRSGSIIPMAEGITNLRTQEIGNINYLIEPKGKGKFTLYEDDGDSENYRQGDYLLTHITCQQEVEETIICFCREGHYQSPVMRETLQVICPEKAPLEVWLGDCLLPRLMSRQRGERPFEAWYYDAEVGIAHVLLPQIRADRDIRIVFSSKDLISI
jgi:alpha-glucosidase